MEVVISRFNENLDWISRLNPDISIKVYNKGNTLNFPSTKLDNIGRESDTFLRYVVETYPHFNTHTAFLQGNPFYHMSNVVEVINNHFEDRLVYLSNKIVTNDNAGCPCHCGLPIETASMKLGVHANDYTFAAGAQYIVPKRLILAKPLEWWEKALTLHNTPSLPYRGNINQAPWVFERLWPNIWNLAL